MRKGIKGAKRPGIQLLFFLSVFFFTANPLSAFGQNEEAKAERNIVGKMKVADKTVELKTNSGGSFQRISGVKPDAVLPVEITYPDGKEGEPVAISVLDGGRINRDKIVDVVKLNAERICAFQFQVTGNTGLFRVLVTKGSDQKLVQVWVGAEAPPVKQ